MTAGVCWGRAQPCPGRERRPGTSSALAEPGFACALLESKVPLRNSGEAGGMCSAEQQAHEATHIIFQSFLQRTTIFSVPIELNYILSGPRSCLDAFEQLGAFTDDALDTVTAG